VSLQSDLFLFFPHSFDRPAKYWHIDLAFMMRKQGLNKRVNGIEPVQEAAAAAREAQSREVAGLRVWAL